MFTQIQSIIQQLQTNILLQKQSTGYWLVDMIMIPILIGMYLLLIQIIFLVLNIISNVFLIKNRNIVLRWTSKEQLYEVIGKPELN